MRTVFAPAARLRKMLHDAAQFLPRGQLMPLLYDLVELASESPYIAPGRSLLAGTDLPHPEYGRIPFHGSDFSSEEERKDVLSPTRVTDALGRVLPQWHASRRITAIKPRRPAAVELA